MADAARITIRVHHGASRARVASEPTDAAPTSGRAAGHGTQQVRAGAEQEPVIGVWVTQRAVDGRATEAALRAVAQALGVRRTSVRLIVGARSRVKIVELSDPPTDLAELLASLR